jgi:hypothetical protein
VLMGGVVVEHHVDRFVGRHLTLDGIEKADELLMPVALHTAADDASRSATLLRFWTPGRAFHSASSRERRLA